ncbi:hypothetical protein DIDNDMLP_00341 [Klebsiella phage KP13-7]|nr:hypothetical protein DIDNDMLP_00341 [Klebsiella phage KP13-7]
MKTPIFEKSKKYAQRISDCIELIQSMRKTFYINHKGSFRYQHESNGIITMSRGKSPFGEVVLIYVPDNIHVTFIDNYLIEISNYIPVQDYTEETEFQYSTLYNNEELLMHYIYSILWNLDIKGKIHINPKINLRTYTMALKNINNYFEITNYNLYKELCNKKFKSMEINHL